MQLHHGTTWQVYLFSKMLVTALLTARPVLRQATRGASDWVGRAKGLGQPVRAILTDYIEVFKDLGKASWNHPFKASIYLSIGSLVTAAVTTRPDYRQYLNDVLGYANELSMCSEHVRNPRAQNYIDDVIRCHSDKRLTYVNLGIAALIIRQPRSAYCCNFQETCSSLQPRLWTLGQRVVDVGVAGRWLLLDTELKDYDINDTQLSSLPNQKQ